MRSKANALLSANHEAQKNECMSLGPCLFGSGVKSGTSFVKHVGELGAPPSIFRGYP